MKNLGKQTILELYGCNSQHLNDIDFIRKSMNDAAYEADATIVQQFFHQFAPQGVSGTIVIVESHINIHTWPEHDYAAIDIFSCSEEMDVARACAYLAYALEATEHSVQSHERGIMTTIEKVRDRKANF